MKLSNKELVQDTLWILAGNIALAMGVAWFILPNDVLTGGLAGVAIALEPLIHLNPELVINVLTVVLFLAGSLVLGKKFAAKTILSTICYPLLLTLLSYLAKHVIAPDTFIMDKYLATIYGGALMGIGVGCVSYRCQYRRYGYSTTDHQQVYPYTASDTRFDSGRAYRTAWCCRIRTASCTYRNSVSLGKQLYDQ